MTLSIDTNKACVMPKSRTASIGCTMRTLSHNLALLPPTYTASCFWHRSLAVAERNVRPVNILLVPYPYTMSASSFQPRENAKSYDPNNSRWGTFKLEQQWLKNDTDNRIASVVMDLLNEASKIGVEIDGIVFPEYALSWNSYRRIVETLQSTASDPQEVAKAVKFLIAGCSEIKERDVLIRGNFVNTSFFYDDEQHSDKKAAITYTQGKHHRWCLTGSQIQNYDLDAVLDCHTNWWEGLRLARREVGSFVFRERSTFSTLICEDLARNDPIHPILQSMGPNIVFVLLMDGPQLPTRWAPRCATGLSEDPGSAVLTFTSRALMHRQNNKPNSRFEANWTIALWKDETQREIPIVCEPPNDASIITLSADRAREITIDGRPNSDAWSWKMTGYRNIKRPKS